MGWSIGYDERWKRDVGYGVPSLCDHPDCSAKIDRGLSYVCGGEPYGGDHGCGLHFCGSHLQHRYPRGEDRGYQNCKRCITYRLPYKPKPDVSEWTAWKLTDPSWQKWRDENPEIVKSLSRKSE
jgi:hypothetical protein